MRGANIPNNHSNHNRDVSRLRGKASVLCNWRQHSRWRPSERRCDLSGQRPSTQPLDWPVHWQGHPRSFLLQQHCPAAQILQLGHLTAQQSVAGHSAAVTKRPSAPCMREEWKFQCPHPQVRVFHNGSNLCGFRERPRHDSRSSAGRQIHQLRRRIQYRHNHTHINGICDSNIHSSNNSDLDGRDIRNFNSNH